MGIIRKDIKRYLQERRALGFKLDEPEHLLYQFDDYLEKLQATIITRKLAVKWACLSDKCKPSHWAKRLSVVRVFARYYSATNPRTEIPPQGLLPYKYQRAKPYIYTENQIIQLINAARKLNSKRGLRASTYATLFGLLAVTGMRISEIVTLDREDANLAEGILIVRKAKLDRVRLIPIHASTVKALQDYIQCRDQVYSTPKTKRFFVSEAGTILTPFAVRYIFNKLSCQIGLRCPSDRFGPRIHDFRHTVAVNMVRDWYKRGKNVEKLLPQLAMFLGHRHLNDTYWYMTATPELLTLAAKRAAERIN
jgi:integrase/recombinase XerD